MSTGGSRRASCGRARSRTILSRIALIPGLSPRRSASCFIRPAILAAGHYGVQLLSTDHLNPSRLCRQHHVLSAVSRWYRTCDMNGDMETAMRELWASRWSYTLALAAVAMLVLTILA